VTASHSRGCLLRCAILHHKSVRVCNKNMFLCGCRVACACLSVACMCVALLIMCVLWRILMIIVLFWFSPFPEKWDPKSCCFVLLTRGWENLKTRPPVVLGSLSVLFGYWNSKRNHKSFESMPVEHLTIRVYLLFFYKGLITLLLFLSKDLVTLLIS